MADHSTTRDQLIEQAAQELRHVSARFGQHLDARRAAIALADAGLLADPEQHAELAEWRAVAKAGGNPWALHHVREALGTPDGRAVGVHAKEVRAERDALLPRLAELTEQAGKLRTTEWLRTCATLPMEQWPPAPAYKGPMVPAAERDALQARIDAVRRWLDDPQDLTPAGQLHQIRAALQSDQHAELEPRCMNGPAKRDTLHMVGVIKALKSAAELDHLPLEPLRRDNFVRLARAIADHWPRDIDKPAAPFDLLETEEL